MQGSKKHQVISIVTPCKDEQENIDLFYEELSRVFLTLSFDFEWLVIDDNSIDLSFTKVKALAEKDSRVKVIKLSKQHGSHLACFCGISHCQGEAIVIMALDLQDSPSNISTLVSKWQEGHKIVWAKRDQSYKREFINQLGANVYYTLFNILIGGEDLRNGSDFFLMDKKVSDYVSHIKEKSPNIISNVLNSGFNQTSFIYQKKPRVHGKSSWTFKRKVMLILELVFSNTVLPLRLFGLLGSLLALSGMVYSLILLDYYFNGQPVPGYTSIMMAILVIGGFNLLLSSLLGEYVWRLSRESRLRPNYIIEEMINLEVRNPLLQG